MKEIRGGKIVHAWRPQPKHQKPIRPVPREPRPSLARDIPLNTLEHIYQVFADEINKHNQPRRGRGRSLAKDSRVIGGRNYAELSEYEKHQILERERLIKQYVLVAAQRTGEPEADLDRVLREIANEITKIPIPEDYDYYNKIRNDDIEILADARRRTPPRAPRRPPRAPLREPLPSPSARPTIAIPGPDDNYYYPLRKVKRYPHLERIPPTPRGRGGREPPKPKREEKIHEKRKHPELINADEFPFLFAPTMNQPHMINENLAYI